MHAPFSPTVGALGVAQSPRCEPACTVLVMQAPAPCSTLSPRATRTGCPRQQSSCAPSPRSSCSTRWPCPPASRERSMGRAPPLCSITSAALLSLRQQVGPTGPSSCTLFLRPSRRVDRAFMEMWLTEHSTCPLTGQVLPPGTQPAPNVQLRRAVQKWARIHAPLLLVGRRG